MDEQERLKRLKEVSQKFLDIIKDDYSYFEEFHKMALEFSGDLLSGKAKIETGTPKKEFFERLNKEIGVEETLLEALDENIKGVKRLIKLLTSTKRTRWTEKIKNELEKLYIQEGRTALQIAEIWGVSLDTVKSALKRFKIRREDYEKKRQIPLFPNEKK